MKKISEESFLKAKKYVFLLLKFRARTENELYRRLKKKGFSEEIIKKTISFLKEKKYIDDAQFCRELVMSRIRKNFSLAKIKQELRQKGVCSSLIEEEINRIKSHYSEKEALRKLIKERLEKIKEKDSLKLKARLFGYLARRGFSLEDIEENLEEILIK